MRRLRLGLSCLPLAVGLLLAASAGSAEATFKAPCVEGAASPKCTFWDARATFIADGDTIKAVVDGSERLVRFTGINAMELHHYSKYASRRRGECHGLAATALVERYIKHSHWRIRLAAQRASSQSGARHRLRRSVWVKVAGRWRDLAKLEMEAGLALWLPNGTEWAHNREYHALAEQARLALRGLYDPTTCGVGPDQDLPISLSLNWDADGNDSHNTNGEWVDIRNGGTRPLSLGGWWFRDSWLKYDAHRRPGYGFPAGTVVPAGGSIRLHMGRGQNTATEFHWGQHTDVFENVSTDRRHLGDGGYLFDPQGDLRASQIYACTVACQDPLAGVVQIRVHPKTPESIDIVNAGAGWVDLGDHILKLRFLHKRDAFIFGYPFPPGTLLAPGESMHVVPGGSRALNSAHVVHLARGSYVLADGGGQLTLRTMTDDVTACASWGRGRCR
jgi:endonuclease YncB( thermonuclease family)